MPTPDSNRLSTQKDIKEVFQNGRRLQKNGISIKYLINRRSDTRFAVLLSGVVWKKAVIRNKIKRIVREYVRSHISVIKSGVDITITVGVLPINKDLSRNIVAGVEEVLYSSGLLASKWKNTL